MLDSAGPSDAGDASEFIVSGGRIGPNALMQLAPALDALHGPALRQALFAACGVQPVPDGSAMVDKAHVAAVHQAIRRALPDTTTFIAHEAGLAMGDYILAYRIPAFTQRLLRALPAPLAARLRTKAICAHAWTFCGSGRVTARTGLPTTFAVHHNPIVRSEHATGPVCTWHAAVFDRLSITLVHRDAHVYEATCCATSAPACTFKIRWR